MLFELIKNPFIQKLNKLFTKNGLTIKFVGGIVRNHFLKISDKNPDIDMVVNAPIEHVLKILQVHNYKIHVLSLQYGTVTIINEEHQIKIELTSLRIDFNHQGRQTQTIYSHSWLEDASRRDFTINAIYCNMEGAFYDPFNGIQHIQQGLVSFIGNPLQRICEDYLRILRFFRCIGFFQNPLFDSSVLTLLKNHQHHLSRLSKERITNELLKILKNPFYDQSLQLMCENNIWLSLGAQQNIKKEYFQIPDIIKNCPDSYLLLSFFENHFLKNCLTLPKRIYKSIQKLKNTQHLNEAFYTHGKDFTLYYAWYIAKHTKSDFEPLKEKVLWLNAKYQTPPVFPLTGTDILKTFAISSKEVGYLLEKSKMYWYQNDFKPSYNDLINYCKLHS